MIPARILAAGFALLKTVLPACTATTQARSANVTGSRAFRPASVNNQPLDDVRKYLAAVEAEPRTASELAERVGRPLEQVLWELRMLERFGWITHRTNWRGLQFWMPVPERQKVL